MNLKHILVSNELEEVSGLLYLPAGGGDQPTWTHNIGEAAIFNSKNDYDIHTQVCLVFRTIFMLHVDLDSINELVLL